MFLTRLGPSAKCIITGDLSQIDLPRYQKSGLRKAIDILNDTNGITTVRLTADDVVRHRLVKAIIMAYEKSDKEMPEKWEAEKAGDNGNSHANGHKKTQEKKKIYSNGQSNGESKS